MQNASDFVFALQGLNETATGRGLYFAAALFSYLLTLLVNLTLIFTVLLEKSLHQPIYIFLCSLCANGICGASCFYPKLLHDLLAAAHRISYSGCLAQMLFLYGYVFCEFTSLTVMAYDRYLAICRPLQYRALMTAQKVRWLLLLTWSFSFLESLVGIALTARLRLCGNRVPKLFCTNWEVVKLACGTAQTTVNNVYGFVLSVSHVSQTALISVSYAHLVRAALRSRSDRRKFTQTCLPHLVTLLVFTHSLVFDVMYSRYGGDAGGGGPELRLLRDALSAEFFVVPPLMNPIIYGINLQQIRSKVLRHLGL